MGQTVCVVLFLFREFKDVNCVNASNTQQLDVFLDNKGHNFVFLCIFWDLEPFNFLEVVRPHNFLTFKLNLLDLESLVDQEHPSVQEEPIHELALLAGL